MVNEMSFGIVADFPLGKYVGNHVGNTESFPSPARLHSALMCAAAQGPRAQLSVDGTLSPCEEDLVALRWLEQHPPSGVHIPPSANSRQQVTAYRKMGLLRAKKSGTKIAQKPASRGVAIGGRVGWCWDHEPPQQVRESIAALCADVPYLGSVESPVKMCVDDVAPTHLADPSLSLFDQQGLAIEVPTDGRTEALLTSHAELFKKAPTVSADQAKADEGDLVPARSVSSLTSVKYREPGSDSSTSSLPWDRVIALGIRRRSAANSSVHLGSIPMEERLNWCVALHRALISIIGFGASPLITGKSSRDSKPSNHVAIQLIDRYDTMTDAYDSEQMFLIMLPANMDLFAEQQLSDAIGRLSVVRRSRIGEQLHVSAPSVSTAAEHFWREPPTGYERCWLTVPAWVPDTRPIRSGGWSLADAVDLSVAMVWREHLEIAEHTQRSDVARGDRRYVLLAEAAAERGVKVHSVRPITKVQPSSYVHKLQAGSLLRPCIATLSLGDLASNTALVAIGQSRHLGGGLLVPHDLPIGMSEI